MFNNSPPTLRIDAPDFSTRLAADLEQARTCSEVAAVLFPESALTGPAFLEADVSGLNEPPKLELLDLHDDFWASTLNYTVFVAKENHFLQYNLESGLYEPVTESSLTGQLLTNLNLVAQHFPPSLKISTFLALKNRQRLRSVIERAKDLLAIDSSFFKDQKHFLNLANGIFNIDNNSFSEFSPNHPISEKMEVKYVSEAKCEMFLEGFLRHILEAEDVDLLQRYLSQILEGINHSQTILVLTGDAGWGKSSLMKILGSLVGWNRVGIIRERLFRDECELSHYADKHLLYHPDMPTDFLDRREASIFKQLCGGDPLWADVKGSNRRMTLEGNYPIILACNGKPKIHVDQDSDAWLRRLVVLSFKKPNHEQHFGRMAELILKTEASGILNWLLEGKAKLLKDKLQLTQTQEQKARAVNLLLGSDSPAAFVRGCLVKKKDGVLGMVDLYEKYQAWCKRHQILPFSSKAFSQMAKTEIEMGFGLKSRHDLVSEGGGVMRGWKGLAMVEAENGQNTSKESGS